MGCKLVIMIGGWYMRHLSVLGFECAFHTRRKIGSIKIVSTAAVLENSEPLLPVSHARGSARAPEISYYVKTRPIRAPHVRRLGAVKFAVHTVTAHFRGEGPRPASPSVRAPGEVANRHVSAN